MVGQSTTGAVNIWGPSQKEVLSLSLAIVAMLIHLLAEVILNTRENGHLARFLLYILAFF